MTISSLLKRSGINAEGGNRLYVPGDDFVTQMRKRTQKAVDDISPQVQSEMVRPYKAESYEEHEYYQVPPPGIDWEPPISEPLPLPSFGIATPIFSVASGSYSSVKTVNIACLTDGVTIHYTLDGTEPTVNKTKYTKQLLIAYDTVLKAKAFKDGLDPSDTATATYVISSWGGAILVNFPTIDSAATVWIDNDIFHFAGWKYDSVDADFDLYYVTGTLGALTETLLKEGASDSFGGAYIRLDSSGNPQIVSIDKTGAIIHFIFNGGWTETEVVAAGSLVENVFVTDSNDYAYVLYYNGVTDAIHVADNSTGSWRNEEVISAPAVDFWRGYANIVESGGTLYIAWYEYTVYPTVTKTVKVTSGSWGSWSIENVVTDMYPGCIMHDGTNLYYLTITTAYQPLIYKKDGSWSLVFSGSVLDSQTYRLSYLASDNTVVFLYSNDSFKIVADYNNQGAWMESTQQDLMIELEQGLIPTFALDITKKWFYALTHRTLDRGTGSITDTYLRYKIVGT